MLVVFFTFVLSAVAAESWTILSNTHGCADGSGITLNGHNRKNLQNCKAACERRPECFAINLMNGYYCQQLRHCDGGATKSPGGWFPIQRQNDIIQAWLLADGICSGTFRTNEGNRHPNQTPFRVGNLFVFGARESGWFKMTAVNADGSFVQNRHSDTDMTPSMSPTEIENIWGSANLGGNYGVEDVTQCGASITTTSTTTTIAPTTPQTGNEVSCRMTIDDVVTEVRYNGQPLEVSGPLNMWTKVNTFSFNKVEGAYLEIVGYEGGACNGCQCSGLLLECDNGFISNTEDWTAVGSSSSNVGATKRFSAPCQSNSGFFLPGQTSKATKIWASGGEKYAWFRAIPVVKPAPITTTITTTTIEPTTPQTAHWKSCRWQSTRDRLVDANQHLVGWTCADNEILTGFGINEDEEDDVSKIQCCELGGHSSVIPETCTFIRAGDQEFQPERASCNAIDRNMVFSGAFDASTFAGDDYTEMNVGKCCEVKCDAPWCQGKDWGINNEKCLTISADADNNDAQDLVCPEGTVVTQVIDGHSGHAHGIQKVASLVCCELDVVAQPTVAPTTSPTTSKPTNAPSLSPTTTKPSYAPTRSPSNAPSFSPSKAPTPSPTMAPSPSPTTAPSQAPTSTADCLLALFQCNPPLSDAEILQGIDDCLPNCMVPSDYVVRRALKGRLLSKNAK